MVAPLRAVARLPIFDARLHYGYGADADVPVKKRVVQMAREHQLLLRSHSDAEAVERRFKQHLAGAHSAPLPAQTSYARPRRLPSTR